MGSRSPEESEIEPFVTEVEAFASGKHIGLFGSYGWGMESGCATGRPVWPMQAPRSGEAKASLPGRARTKMHSISAGSWERLWRPQKHNAES